MSRWRWRGTTSCWHHPTGLESFESTLVALEKRARMMTWLVTRKRSLRQLRSLTLRRQPQLADLHYWKSESGLKCHHAYDVQNWYEDLLFEPVENIPLDAGDSWMFVASSCSVFRWHCPGSCCGCQHRQHKKDRLSQHTVFRRKRGWKKLNRAVRASVLC